MPEILARRAVELLSPVFGLALAMSLACSMSLRHGHADSPIADDAASIQPLVAGDPAPKFVVKDIEGKNVHFDPRELERPVILITFRGGWCPYCNMHLSELRHVLPELEAQDIDIYFLSGDRPDQLVASLRPETRDDVNELGYTLLSDASATAAMALGIAFRADGSLTERLTGRGRDIAGSSLERAGVLPVPAVFAIDVTGNIAFAYTNADYKVRLSADELRDVAAAL